MKIRGAKESEIEELIRLQRLVFRPDEGEQAEDRYRAYVQEDPSYKLEQSRVLLHRGRIAGHLRIWDRVVRIRGLDLRAGGIGGLLVHPNFRRQGFAQALMRDSEKYLTNEGYDLGLLFTIIGTPFYERQGWIPVPLPLFEMSMSSCVNEEVLSKNVRRLEIERDLKVVASIYSSYIKEMTGPEVRKEGYWVSGPSRYRNVFPEWGVEWKGKVIAYVNFEVQKHRVWVKEACFFPEYEQALDDIASLLIKKSRLEGNKPLVGSLPLKHPLTCLLARVTGSQVRWDWHHEMMVKGVNLASLSEKFGGASSYLEDEYSFWKVVLGPNDIFSNVLQRPWIGSHPLCMGPFYWWTDIF